MLQRCTKRLMTVVIALAFAFAIVPRGWLHRCDQAQVDHHHPDRATLYDDLDCEFCAVVVATFDDRLALPRLPQATAADVVRATAIPSDEADAALITRTRGPPLV